MILSAFRTVLILCATTMQIFPRMTPREGRLYARFRIRVDGARAVIEYEYVRFCEHGPRDGKTLFLPA